MCEPTALAIGSLAVNAGGSLLGAGGQNKAHKANKANALNALRLGTADVNARLDEETAAAQQARQGIVEQGTANVATATTSAAESGVAGGSVDALIAGILREQAKALGTLDTNLEGVRAQGGRQKAGLLADAQSQIAGVPKASGAATALGVAGAGLSFLNQYRLNNPLTPRGS
jgi:hypothetical protein